MSDGALIQEHAHFNPKLGKRYRVLVRHDDAWVPLLWLRVGRDGSVYLGSAQGKPTFLREGRKAPNHGSITVKYSEGDEVDIDSVDNPTKTSFHASGAINSLGKRSYRKNLRDSIAQEWLCSFLFRHPKDARRRIQDSAIRNTDVCLNYPINQLRPMQGYVCFSKSKVHSLLRTKDVTYQLDICFDYKNIQWNIENPEDKEDIILQIILYHGVEGYWPPYTYELFTVNKSSYS